MTDDLVTRLRYQADTAKKNYPEVFRVSEDITYEAASRIEKLESGQEEWNRICNSYAARIDELEAALREMIGALNDPKGGEHVYDMRNASYIARKALEKKDD